MSYLRPHAQLVWALPLLLIAAVSAFAEEIVPISLRDTHDLTRQEWIHLAIGLLGGIAFLKYGIEKMGDSLKIVAGDKMKMVMWRLTRNRFMSLFTGAFITAVVQSSTVTTVLLVGFVSARLMSLAQSIGVILGADIGTTLTAQILAFNISQYAMLPIAIGFGITFLTKKESTAHIGSAIMGVGLVFFGISIISQAMQPLRAYEPFIEMMSHLANPFLGIIVGAVITAILHSSAATLAIAIALAAQGLLQLEAGIAITLGANIGTCLPAALVAIGKSREAMRVAAAHVSFKVIGILLVLPVLPYFVEFVMHVSPAPLDAEAAANMGAHVPRQIANAHTMFNIGIALLFLPFTTQFARLLNRLIPDKPLDELEIKPRFLDEFLLATPSLALTAVRSEMRRMGQEVNSMMEQILPAVTEGTRADLRRVEKKDDDVDSLYGHIVTYLGQISKKQLTEKQSAEMLGLMYATHHLENIGDLIETNLVTLGHQRIDSTVEISAKTKEVIGTVHRVVQQSVIESLKAITELDRDAAQRVLNMKADFNKLIGQSVTHQTQRLVAPERNRINAFSVEMDIIDRLQRVYFHARRIASSTLSILNEDSPQA